MEAEGAGSLESIVDGLSVSFCKSWMRSTIGRFTENWKLQYYERSLRNASTLKLIAKVKHVLIRKGVRLG